MCDEDPGDGAFEGGFEVLGEPAATAEPSEGTFHNPATRQQFEGVFGGVGSLDDLEGPLAKLGHGGAQLAAGIAAIGEDVAQQAVRKRDR